MEQTGTGKTVEEAKKAINSFLTEKDKAIFALILEKEMKEPLCSVQQEVREMQSALQGLVVLGEYKTGNNNYTALDFQNDCENICNLVLKKLAVVQNELEKLEKKQMPR